MQRPDCSRFAPCAAADPTYGRLVRQAAAAGVQVVAARVSHEPLAGLAAALSRDGSLGTAAGVSGAGEWVVRYLGPVQVELGYKAAR